MQATRWAVVGLLWPWLAAAAPTPSIVFHYGTTLPVPELALFEWVVVQPEHLEPGDLEELRRRGATVFAYVSVGELARSDRWFSRLAPRPGRVTNAGWDSVLLDPLDPQDRALVLERFEALWAAGHRAFFLDTVDSYERLEGDRAARATATAELINSVSGRHPEAKLLLNRGFEVLPLLASAPVGVVAESLFSSYDAAADRYRPTTAGDQQWLQAALRKAARDHGVVPIVVDYSPPGARPAARELAQRIAAAGFVPYVGPGKLDRLGVGAIEPLPRRVLVVFDGELTESPAHRALALPLEHLGYSVDFAPVDALPRGALSDRYQGVVTWLRAPAPDPRALGAWLGDRLDEPLRVALLGDHGLPPDHPVMSRLGVAAAKGPARPGALRLESSTGFEARPRRVLAPGLALRLAGQSARAIAAVEDERSGERFVCAAIGPAGGVALSPCLLESGAAGSTRWVLDPFAFLAEALNLGPLASIDPATHEGKRAAILHVDLEGADADVPGNVRTFDVLARQVLRQWSGPALLTGATKTPGGLSALSSRRPWTVQAADPGAAPVVEYDAAPDRRSVSHLPPLGVPATGVRSVPALARVYGGSRLDRPALLDAAPVWSALEAAGTPRRLRPVYLRFAASACGQPGTARALRALLMKSAAAQAPISFELYAARAREAHASAVGRTLDGRHVVVGGASAGTAIRIPAALGCVRASNGAAEPRWEAATGARSFLAVVACAGGRSDGL